MTDDTAVALTHLGHSCVLLEVGTAPAVSRILLDPGNLGLPLDDLDPVDAVLVTHGHPDHLDVRQLHAVRSRGTLPVFGPPDIRDQLTDIDVDFNAVEPGTFEVAGVPMVAGHCGHETLYPGVPLPENLGYEIADRVFAPGDSLLVPTRQVEVLLAPLAGPWMKLSEGIDFVRAIAPTTVIPIHDAGLAPAHRQLHRALFTSFAPDDVTVQPLELSEPTPV